MVTFAELPSTILKQGTAGFAANSLGALPSAHGVPKSGYLRTSERPRQRTRSRTPRNP